MTPDEVKALPLGAPVTYSATLYRAASYAERYRLKTWRRFDLKGQYPAIYIGWRTLTDGRADWEDEVGYVFDADPATRQVAALVVTGVRRAPVLVPCADLGTQNADP